MSEILRLTNLTQSYNGQPVLSGVNLALGAKERLVILGSSGSGKSTLLRLIAGIDAPKEGEIHIDGRLASTKGSVLVAPERRDVALVFQGLALFPHLRALDQIAFAAQGHGGGDLARQLLDSVGLGHRAGAKLDELSGGERQRIALARALAQQPKLLLMDEPFASLDDEKRSGMRDLLRSLLDKSGATLVLVTHSRDDALQLAQRVLVLDRGVPIASDNIENVIYRPIHVAAARALGLGQILPGKALSPDTAQTSFGVVQIASPASGQVSLLVRPGQPEISNTHGVEAQIISLEFRSPDMHEVSRNVLVRCGDATLRVRSVDPDLTIGQRVRVRINGSCEVLKS